MNEKKLIAQDVEEKLARIIINFVTSNGLTISNVKDVTDTVCSYMTDNAVLEKTNNLQEND